MFLLLSLEVESSIISADAHSSWLFWCGDGIQCNGSSKSGAKPAAGPAPRCPIPCSATGMVYLHTQILECKLYIYNKYLCVCQGAIFHFAVALRSKHLCLLCPAVFRCHPLSPLEVAGGGQLMTTLMRGGSASWSGTGQQLLVADRNARYGSALWRRRLKNSPPSTSRCRLVCAKDFLTFFKSKMWMSTDILLIAIWEMCDVVGSSVSFQILTVCTFLNATHGKPRFYANRAYCVEFHIPWITAFVHNFYLKSQDWTESNINCDVLLLLWGKRYDRFCLHKIAPKKMQKRLYLFHR